MKKKLEKHNYKVENSSRRKLLPFIIFDPHKAQQALQIEKNDKAWVQQNKSCFIINFRCVCVSWTFG